MVYSKKHILVSPLAAFLFAAGGMTVAVATSEGMVAIRKLSLQTVNTSPVISVVLATAMGLAETALMADGS